MKTRGNPPPQEGEEDLTEVEQVGSLTMHKEMTDLRVVRIMEAKMGIMVRETVMEILEVENKVEVILGAICEVKVEEEVDLTKVQMLDILG